MIKKAIFNCEDSLFIWTNQLFLIKKFITQL